MPALPKSTKFVVHLHGATQASIKSEEEREGLRRDASVKILGAMTQMFAFTAGPMRVVMVDPNIPPPEGVRADDNALLSTLEHARLQAEKTVSVLAPSQRPQLEFVPDLQNLQLHGGEQLAPLVPLDSLQSLPHALDPELHYALLSKRALALSGLHTPACDIIDFDTMVPATLEDCCAPCRQQDDTDSESRINDACSGPRRAWLLRETDRAIAHLRAHPLPAILKLQQTMGGVGTFWIRTSLELVEVENFIVRDYLPLHLPKINPSNAHLHPASLILSDVVLDAVATRAVSFFVLKDGKYVFISSVRQLMSTGNRWLGASIFYSEQAALEARMASTMQKVSEFLHSMSYFGPVGIDVIEDVRGALWVVDLNVRAASSHILGVLGEHHFSPRGMDCACLISRSLAMGREVFGEMMGAQIEQGRVVVVAWFEEGTGKSSCRLVVGAEGEEALGEEVERIDRLGVL